MRKQRLLLAALPLILIGCSGETLQEYVFAAETDSWETELFVEQHPAAENISEEALLQVQHAGDSADIESVEVQLWIDRLGGGSTSTSLSYMPEDGSLEMLLSNYDFVYEEEKGNPIHVQVTWQEDQEEYTDEMVLEPAGSQETEG
ncbi:hypothetical protein [Alkalicoccus urumqiensis]|nr:hypothetical protein [Alkalicoccus urumqiensis]